MEATEDIPAAREKRPPLLKQFSIMSAGTTATSTAATTGDSDKKKSSEAKVQQNLTLIKMVKDKTNDCVLQNHVVLQGECKVTISCEVNGRTVAQRTEKVPPLAHSYEEALLLTPAPISPTATAEAENMKSLSIGTIHK